MTVCLLVYCLPPPPSTRQQRGQGCLSHSPQNPAPVSGAGGLQKTGSRGRGAGGGAPHTQPIPTLQKNAQTIRTRNSLEESQLAKLRPGPQAGDARAPGRRSPRVLRERGSCVTTRASSGLSSFPFPRTEAHGVTRPQPGAPSPRIPSPASPASAVASSEGLPQLHAHPTPRLPPGLLPGLHFSPPQLRRLNTQI